MKIAILSFYSGHVERGVENWVKGLAARLAKNHKITVYQNEIDSKKFKYSIVSTNIPTNYNKSIVKLGSFWDLKPIRRFFLDYYSRKIAQFTLVLLPQLWRERHDIIIPTNGGWQPALVRILTWLKGGKMAIVGHSGKGWDERNNIYTFPNIFVGLSKFAREWARKINPLIKTVYIPNGVNLKKFTPKGKRANISLERPIILCVSAVEKGKRLDLSIQTISKLNKGSLLMLGGGSNEAEIRELANKLLPGRFLIRKVKMDEIHKYYRSCDLFTLPSWPNEAFGMVYLEAMASGLPVVATDDELRREIVGDAGILVDPTDIDAYAKALEKALKTDWGNKPRKQAEKYSWDIVVKKYENLFKEIVSN
jgi:glycosyltransferase involved in cell wall biosynthesis